MSRSLTTSPVPGADQACRAGAVSVFSGQEGLVAFSAATHRVQACISQWLSNFGRPLLQQIILVARPLDSWLPGPDLLPEASFRCPDSKLSLMSRPGRQAIAA